MIQIPTSFFRFLLVGVLNTLIGFSMMSFSFHIVGFGYYPSTFLGNSIGAIVSYVLNRNFTFKSNAKIASSAFRFLLVILSCYVISYRLSEWIVHWMVVDSIGIPIAFEKDVAMVLGMGIYTLLNYWGQKRFVFQANKRESSISK